jgi:hypothetical protein
MKQEPELLLQLQYPPGDTDRNEINLIKTLLYRFRGVHGVVETITLAVGEILNIIYIACDIVYQYL